MSERTLRTNLFVVMMIIFFGIYRFGVPSNFMVAFFYIGGALDALLQADSMSFVPAVAYFLWLTLYMLSVPILGVLQLCVLEKLSWKKYCRTVLPFLFVIAWWGTLVRLASFGPIGVTLVDTEFWTENIGFCASPLVVTAAGVVEIILIKRERRELSEDLG